MPPLQQQTQKEKRQGRRMNPYRRQRLNLAGSATNATFEFVGSQFEWAQAQQLHSNTVENEWQNMTSSENGDSTNDYDDNEQSSLKQVNETNELVVMLASLENPSKNQLDINTKRGTILELEQNDAIIQPLEQSEPVMVPEMLQCISIVTNDNGNDNETDLSLQQDDVSTILTDQTSSGRSRSSRSRSRSRKTQTRVRGRRRVGKRDARGNDQIQTEEDVEEHPVDEAGNESKRRKIATDNDHDNTIANHAMNVDGNEEIVMMEGIHENNINLELHPSRTTAPRGRNRSNRGGKIRGRKDLIKSPPSRKPRGKRGRPNTIPGTTRNDDVRGSDQDEPPEPISDMSQPLVDTVPDVPEPEPRSTLVLRKFLESLCASDLVLSRDRLLRLGTYMLDYFVSQAWCRPFVNPEDESAVYYRLIITHLMDLTTVEHNLWAGVYDGSVSRFYEDLAQIMYNAFKFHPEGTIIFNEANSMLACFVDLTTKFSKPPHDLSKFDDNLSQVTAKLPHEEFSDVCGVSPNVESRLYIVPLYSFRQVSRSGSNVAKLPQAAAERLDPMSRPLFDVFDRRHLPPVRFQPTEMHCNFGRLYITMGAQNIKNCRDEQNAILIIVKDVSYMRGENRLRCNAIVSKPFGELRELDTIGFPELQDARYWTRVAFLDRVALDIKVGPKFFDKYLRTPFKVSEYDKGMITSQQHDAFLAALNLRQDNLYEGLSIWQRLVAEANRVKVPIESIESLGKPIQVDAEGFFKRVFHVPGDDKYVVQNFKEISEGTLETRIKEAVCCLKTKGVSNTGQIRSVYKDDEDDELVGLSMERYSYTLKEYAFNTRSPITGEQKFRLIHDMVKGIKALHDAGFAHRDLSEVNMMVNNTAERLGDGSTKPELVVIDFGKAEFINRDDVLTWSVGEVSNEKLEHLPWIKTVPDHGYKLYRSAATLPRTKNDHAVLQYPIDPCAEDIYAVGVLAWRIFSGQAPWGGILDTDLKNLREIVTDPIKIRFHIEKNVNGKKSREMLLKCITSTPQERSTARELLDWLLQAKDELISEWATSGRMRIRKQF